MQIWQEEREQKFQGDEMREGKKKKNLGETPPVGIERKREEPFWIIFFFCCGEVSSLHESERERWSERALDCSANTCEYSRREEKIDS